MINKLCRWQSGWLVIGMLLLWQGQALAAPGEFGFEQVAHRARQLAEQSFNPPQRIPDFLADLAYDEYRDIRFRPARTLWRDTESSFQVQFIHPGLYYTHPVEINVVDGGSVQRVLFQPDMFDYGSNKFADQVPADLGFAGFRLNYPIKDPQIHHQVIVFAGASYFRAVGKNQGFGLSARGLAIDTGLPSGEEFPFFKEFWLQRPAADANAMTVFALLDSKRITGAYRFVIRPGETTVVDVKVRLFQRKGIEQLGIAPLTSMFLYDEATPRPPGYWRQEVHDSDGLLINTADDLWIWRPLVDPRRLLVSAFALNNPRGFGLMQRDRNFADYQDLEARYENRPSTWITPLGDWGEGQVRLIEIPSDSETNDNIVAFWVPKSTPEVGKPIDFDYRLDWQERGVLAPQLGFVSATRVAPVKDGQGITQFVLDFEGEDLSGQAPDAPIEGVVDVGDGGDLLHQSIRKNPVTNGWRLAFKVKREGSDPLELRAYLKLKDQTLSETWSYQLAP